MAHLLPCAHCRMRCWHLIRPTGAERRSDKAFTPHPTLMAHLLPCAHCRMRCWRIYPAYGCRT
ncbi:hypothetical protein ACLB1E_11710 [Escherichia coli]